MSIKRIISIFRNDFINSIRDKMIVYLMIAPILLALVVKFFIPGYENISIKFGVEETLKSSIGSFLENYADVEYFENRSEIYNRIEQYDDFFGISMGTDGNFDFILQGNENERNIEIANSLLNYYSTPGVVRDSLDIEIKSSGKTLPVLATIGFIFVILVSYLFGGLTIAFNMIEEKESETLKALDVTPLKLGELVVGRSILGYFMPIVHAYLGVLIMGFEGINMFMLLIITLVSSLIGIVFGFAIGFISSNQFNGITNMKIGLLILMIPTILAFFLPKGAQIFLYWAPTYWSAMALKDLVNVQQGWGNIFGQILGIILTLAIFILILTPRFKRTLKL